MKPIDANVFVVIERKNGEMHLMDNGRLSIFLNRGNAEDWAEEFGGDLRFTIMEMTLNKAYSLNKKPK